MVNAKELYRTSMLTIIGDSPLMNKCELNTNHMIEKGHAMDYLRNAQLEFSNEAFLAKYYSQLDEVYVSCFVKSCAKAFRIICGVIWILGLKKGSNISNF